MAHKKGLGSSRNGRDSNSQRLGFKAFGGQVVPGGTIIVRQRGTRVKPGLNVGRGKDDTLFAKITGRIKFLNKGSIGRFVPLCLSMRQKFGLRRETAAMAAWPFGGRSLSRVVDRLAVTAARVATS